MNEDLGLEFDLVDEPDDNDAPQQDIEIDDAHLAELLFAGQRAK